MTKIKLLLALAAASLLAACATTPSPYTDAAPRAAAPPARAPVQAQALAPQAVPVQTRLLHAIDLLHQGQPEPAKAELTAVLAQLPDPTAQRLLDGIDRDPKVLLGERNFPYKLKPGETLTTVAERFLGDPMLFYALARYNGIETPDAVEPGRTILIPGVIKRAPAPTVTATAPAPAVPPAPVAKAAPSANPARASALRRRALEDMNKGSVDVAVALLEQAMPLDPNNALIRNDLDRALRIQASLKRR